MSLYSREILSTDIGPVVVLVGRGLIEEGLGAGSTGGVPIGITQIGIGQLVIITSGTATIGVRVVELLTGQRGGRRRETAVLVSTSIQS